MRLRLKLTTRAARELEAIRAYIRRRNPKGAERVRSQIRNSIRTLQDFPGTGRPTTKPGVRLSVVPRYGYKIYFVVAEGELRVIHIRHGARADPDLDELEL